MIFLILFKRLRIDHDFGFNNWHSKFSIISNKALPILSSKAELIFKHLSIHFEKITSKDDKESRVGNIFDKYDFVLVRPDLYVYGGCDLENISNIIESLEDTFFLKL